MRNAKIETDGNVVGQSKYRLDLNKFDRIRLQHKTIAALHVYFLPLTLLIPPDTYASDMSFV